MKVVAVKNRLAAQNMRRAMKFYQTVFGFHMLDSGEGWCELSFGTCVIALQGGHDGSARHVSLSIEVDNVHRAIDHVVHHGGRVVLPPEGTDADGALWAEYQDTEGNIVRMTQRS